MDPTDADADDGAGLHRVVFGGPDQSDVFSGFGGGVPEASHELPASHLSGEVLLTGTDVGCPVEFPVETEYRAPTTGREDAVESPMDVESSVDTAETETELESGLDTQESVEQRLPGFGLGGPGMQANLAEESGSDNTEPEGEIPLPSPLFSSAVVNDSTFAQRIPSENQAPSPRSEV